MIFTLPLLTAFLLPLAPPPQPVPDGSGGSDPGDPTLEPSDPDPDQGKPRTEIIFLQNPQVMTPARAMLLFERVVRSGPAGVIVQGKGPNVIVARDYAANLERFRSLLSALDQPGEPGLHIYVRPVQFARASDLARVLESLYDNASPPRMVADDRTQQLIIMTTPKRYLEIDKMLRRYDVAPEPGRERQLRVLPSPAAPLGEH